MIYSLVVLKGWQGFYNFSRRIVYVKTRYNRIVRQNFEFNEGAVNLEKEGINLIFLNII